MYPLNTFSHTNIFLLQACTFLCNFLRLHKHKDRLAMGQRKRQ